MALKSNLGKIARGLDPALDRAAYATAADVAALERQLTPVDSGDLKGSERIEPARGSGAGQYQVVAGEPGSVDYAVFVERGTTNPNYPEQPYAEPAARAIDPTFRAKRELNDLARKNRA